MAKAEDERSLYVTVWVWLVVLLVVGVAVMALPISKLAAVALVLAVATAKATMVVRNYMHLKSEHLLIFLIALVPVLFFIGLALVLIPDIALRG